MAGKAGSGLKVLPATRRVAQVEIQFRQQHGVAQIILPGQLRRELADFADDVLAELNRGGFQEERRAFRRAGSMLTPRRPN